MNTLKNVILRLNIRNSSLKVDEYSDSDANITVLADENHRYCWLWYKIEHYQLLLGESNCGVKAPVFFHYKLSILINKFKKNLSNTLLFYKNF